MDVSSICWTVSPMADHDPLCPQHGMTRRFISEFDTPCDCALIARVRADERDRLRAKVLNLPHGHDRHGSVCALTYFGPEYPECTCWKAGVLALFDEPPALPGSVTATTVSTDVRAARSIYDGTRWGR